MQQSRRRVLRHLGGGLAASALGGTLAGRAFAQPGEFPSRVVRLVWPYSAGGSGDPVARGLAEGLGKLWGKAVVVDNKPGAGGMIGADAVAKAQPDGHTLLLSLTAVIQTPLLYSKPLYDPVRDLSAITEVGTIAQALVVHPSLQVNDVKGLVAYARNLGKPLPYGTVGLGSSSHLQMEVVAKDLGIEVLHVPYKGESPLVTDLLGGQIQVGLVSALSASRYAASGKLKPLAVGGMGRSPLLPQVPAMAEVGSTGMQRAGWFGLFAPTGTPRPIVDKIAGDAVKVLADAQLRERLLEMGIAVRSSNPAEFTGMVKREQVYWGDLIRNANIRLD